MKVPGSRKPVAVFMALLGAAVAIYLSQRNGDATPPASPDKTDKRAVSTTPGKAVDFDFYLLAMTLHPAYCADGHSREPECRTGKLTMLSIHGLWPERKAHGRYPKDCPGPPLNLEPTLERKLAKLMPGMTDGLHEHEWRKHGTCSGLDDDVYYQHTVEYARMIDAMLNGHLTSLAGKTTSAARLRDFMNSRTPGYGDTLTFHCRTLRGAPPEHRQQPYLVEIRQCISRDRSDGAPSGIAYCRDYDRQDQGCGGTFRIAEPR